MPVDRIPYVIWPGVDQPVALSYTLSHGISPGRATLQLLPQDVSRISLTGDLIFGDGVTTIVLRNCKAAQLRTNLDGSGLTWSLDILDRRWKWIECGFIQGTYNVPDSTRDVTRPPPVGGPYLAPAQLYIPWTVRTPHQLLALCLEAMGETVYRIDAPNTLYPLPNISWDYCNPAQALNALAEELGCRVVYRPDVDGVWVVPIGQGLLLPPGSISREAPALSNPQRPDTIVCVGAPVKFEVEWVLEAVGEEFDGRLLPIAHLSYAPPIMATRHSYKVTPENIPDAGYTLTIRIVYKGTVYTCSYLTASGSIQDAVDGLVVEVNEFVGGQGFLATSEDGYLLVTGPLDGSTFTLTATADGQAVLTAELESVGGRRDKPHPWAHDMGPDFANAQETERLTHKEAQQLAAKSVYRYYRIVNVNVVEGYPIPAWIPQYGFLDIIQRVVLLDEQINQVVPQAEDAQVMSADGYPIIRDFYNGTFRQPPARCFGRATEADFSKWRVDTTENTEAHQEVLSDFQIVPERQLIIFNDYVYLAHNQLYYPAPIRLRCACHLRHPTNNSLVRSEHVYTFPGPRLGTQPAVIRHEDVEYLVKAMYEVTPGGYFLPDTLTLKQVVSNSGEAVERANYYLLKAAAKYQIIGSGDRDYNGIEPVFIDGAIQQVTWSIDCESRGADTTASRNSEHSIYTPKYPERLRIEYLQSQIGQRVMPQAERPKAADLTTRRRDIHKAPRPGAPQ